MTQKPKRCRCYRAWVWASGAIEISNGARLKGAIEIAVFRDRRAALVGNRVMEVSGRLAYDGQTLLVPGVPEAADQDAAMDALLAWLDWIAPKLARRLPARRYTLRGVPA